MLLVICFAVDFCFWLHIWRRAGYALEPNLDIIGNVSSNTSILILQRENDTQTPVEQTFLLQQKLIDVRHPDHTLMTFQILITYSILHHNGKLV